MESGEQYKENRSGGYGGSALSARASQAYKVSTFEGLDQNELMVEAARVMLQKVHLGRDSYRARRLDEMTNHHAKVFSILALLLQSLEQNRPSMDAETQKVARDVARFYRGFNQRLVYVLRAKSVEDEFAFLIDELTKFYRLWQPKPATQAPSASSISAAPTESPMYTGIGQMVI